MRTLTLMVMALALGVAARATEHPEHPMSQDKTPAQEYPVGSKEWTRQMNREYSQAVEEHVNSPDGFKVHDEVLGKDWSLKLLRIHKKRIVHLGGGSFFACADFKSAAKGGKAKLDLDFYATKSGDGWKIDKVLIHKLEGKARYTYNENNEMVPLQ